MTELNQTITSAGSLLGSTGLIAQAGSTLDRDQARKALSTPSSIAADYSGNSVSTFRTPALSALHAARQLLQKEDRESARNLASSPELNKEISVTANLVAQSGPSSGVVIKALAASGPAGAKAVQELLTENGFSVKLDTGDDKTIHTAAIQTIKPRFQFAGEAIMQIIDGRYFQAVRKTDQIFLDSAALDGKEPLVTFPTAGNTDVYIFKASAYSGSLAKEDPHSAGLKVIQGISGRKTDAAFSGVVFPKVEMKSFSSSGLPADVTKDVDIRAGLGSIIYIDEQGEKPVPKILELAQSQGKKGKAYVIDEPFVVLTCQKKDGKLLDASIISSDALIEKN